MFPGIADRMQKELAQLSPSSVKVCRLYIYISLFLIVAHDTFLFSGQDCRTSRAKVLRMDWWIYSGFSQHLPKSLVLQARV